VRCCKRESGKSNPIEKYCPNVIRIYSKKHLTKANSEVPRLRHAIKLSAMNGTGTTAKIIKEGILLFVDRILNTFFFLLFLFSKLL